MHVNALMYGGGNMAKFGKNKYRDRSRRHFKWDLLVRYVLLMDESHPEVCKVNVILRQKKGEQ